MLKNDSVPKIKNLKIIPLYDENSVKKTIVVSSQNFQDFSSATKKSQLTVCRSTRSLPEKRRLRMFRDKV